MARGWSSFRSVGKMFSLLPGGARKAVINREVDRSDVFILPLHRRCGQPAPDSKFSSYTEEEFRRALSRWKKTKSPEVLIFFKSLDNAVGG